MANLYVGVIASALQQYDNNYSIPYQVYEDMAWGSLQEAPIFDSKFPPGSLERLRIFNRYASESRDAQTGNQYPIGKKCN